MKILIIGLGYAGKRYLKAFDYIAKTENINIEIAYLGRNKLQVNLPYYQSVDDALMFSPDIIVVCVNDENHIEILTKLAKYKGFIICEKPLVSPKDNYKILPSILPEINGFALNLVERYSTVTKRLKTIISKKKWSLIRAHFYWGKNRLNDYRPTCGVTSEIIHALDLVKWISSDKNSIKIKRGIGICSDFSISGSGILDSVSLIANMGDATISGYSSFTNIQRQRNLDFIFVDNTGELIYARAVYDTPCWDCDQLKIWKLDSTGSGEEIIIEDYETELCVDEHDLATIIKLSKLCKDVIRFVIEKKPPSIPFADLKTAIDIQKTLNEIDINTYTPTPVCYIRGASRVTLNKNANLERLG